MKSFASAVLWTAACLVLATLARSQPAAPKHADLERNPTQKFVVWNTVTSLTAIEQAADVAFTSMGRNIVNPVSMVWVLQSSGSLVAVASKPIEETAEAGEEMGRRGQQAVRQRHGLLPRHLDLPDRRRHPAGYGELRPADL